MSGSQSNTDDRRDAVVIGAGIVGLCCAAYLQRDGWRVTLLDPGAPGEGCSYGNACMLSVGPAMPVAAPGILWRVPGMLRDPLGPLAIRWSYMPRLAPWLVRFLRESVRKRVERTVAEFAILGNRGHVAYEPLLDAAAAGDLIRKRGALEVFETKKAFEAARWQIELRRRHGAQLEVVGPEQIPQIEPALAPIFAGGVLRTDADHVANPLMLSQAIARLIEGGGGNFVRQRALGISTDGDGRHRVRTEDGAWTGSVVVIAAGAWSKPLAASVGVRVPLDTERGYHVQLPAPGVEMRIPVKSTEGGFYLTPMAQGLRIAGTDELGGLAAPPDWRRAEAMLKRARRMVPAMDERGAERWMGFRPSTPDSKPIIGPVRERPGLFLAFGHGHLGLSFGAVTGEAIADLAAGRVPQIDMAPFRAERF